MNRGKLVIITILSVAVVAAVFSTWYHYRGQHRVLDFWGTSTAVLIVESPTVRVYQLGESAPAEESTDSDSPASETAETEPPPPKAVEFSGLDWAVVASEDAKAAKGINNVRRALVLDLTYDWQTPRPTTDPQWQYALAVNDGRVWATLLFDFDSRQVGLAGGKKTILLDPEANADLHGFFEEQFDAAGSPAKPGAEKSAAESTGKSPDATHQPGPDDPPVIPADEPIKPDEPVKPADEPAEKPAAEKKT